MIGGGVTSGLCVSEYCSEVFDKGIYYFAVSAYEGNGTNIKNEAVEQKEYRDTAVSMMNQAREKFLVLREKPNYEQGVATGIILRIISDDTNFGDKTQKLFAKTIQYRR